MSGVRAVGCAVALSLGLHTGVALGLRALGFGPAEPLPPLFVDLVEPVVAVSEAPRPERPPPVRPRATRPAAPPAPAGAPSEAPPAPSVAAPAAPDAPPAPPIEPAAPPAPPPPAPVEPAPAPAPPPAPAVVATPPGPTAAPPREPAPEARAAAAASPPPPGNTSHEAGTPPSPSAPPGDGATAAAAPTPAHPTTGGAAEPGQRPTASAAGSVAGGGEPVETAESSTLAALPGGQGGSVPPEYDAYVRALRRRIQERLAYPWLAVRQGLSGTVELELSLDSGGRLSAVTAVGREAPGVLRDAAFRAVRGATPFPFPSGLVARPLIIRLPVVFELR